MLPRNFAYTNKMLTTVWTPSVSEIGQTRKQVEKFRGCDICFMETKPRPFEMGVKTKPDPLQ